MLKFYSASTSIVDTKRAITECIYNAFDGEENHDCDLLIIYTAMGHNFKDLLSEARRLCPSAEIAGCTCSGVIGKEGPNESIKALALMAVRGKKDHFAVASKGDLLGSDLHKESALLTHEIKKRCHSINMVFIHPSFDVLDKSLIQGIESVLGPLPVIGGVSLDNMKFISCYQFHNDKILEHGIVMIAFGDPELEVICQMNHGFEIIGDPFTVTKAGDNRIFELDGKKAWKRWTERLGLPESSTAAEVLVFSPLGVPLPHEYHDEYESGFRLFGSTPNPDQSILNVTGPQEKIWLARRNEDKIHDGVERMMIRVLDKCAGRKPQAVFQADCAARGKLLFGRIMKEELVSQLQYPLCRGENIPWFGMYGGSEFAPINGKNMIHAFTTSLYVIVKKSQINPEKKSFENTSLISSKLFEKSRIGNLELKNRFIRSATWYGMANMDGTMTASSVASLLPVALSGIGLMISEMLYVSRDGICGPMSAGISHDSHIPGLRRMTDFVHRAGCQMVAQLNHGGLLSIPALAGSEPLGPSPLKTPDSITGKAMTEENIEAMITAFSESAVRAKKSGFDGIQIHSAHGMLLSQFLSPVFNKRTDEYGGSLENRSRLLLKVVQAVRNSVGPDFALLVKINSEDLIPGGLSVDEMINTAVMLEQSGTDAIEISGGTLSAFFMGDPENSIVPRVKKHIYYRDAATELKKKIKIPVILVGGIRTFGEAEEVINSGIADYIALGRPLIREPDLISKWKSGNLKKADCISESACLVEGAQGRGVHCVHINRS